jgi:hypothetical protein
MAGTEGKAAELQRLAQSGHGSVARRHARIAQVDLAELEEAHARGLAREVDLQRLDQAADQARAHHRQRLGDRVDARARVRRCRRSRAPSARRRS